MSIKVYGAEDLAPKAEETKPVATEAKADAETKESESGTEETDEAELKAEAQYAEAEVDAESEEQAEEKDDEKDQEPKKKSSFKRRVDKLTKKLTDKEREIEYWKAEAMKGKDAPSPKAETAKEQDDSQAKPKSEDFETHAEFVEALTEWKAEQLLSKREAKQKQESVKTEIEKKKERVGKEIRELQAKNEEFAELLTEVGDIPMSTAVESLILDAESPALLWFELAKDVEAYERLNSLPALQAAKEVGRIEARLAKSAEAQTQAKPKTTKAPAPVNPLNKSQAKVTKSIDDPDLSFADYEKLRRAELRKRSA